MTNHGSIWSGISFNEIFKTIDLHIILNFSLQQLGHADLPYCPMGKRHSWPTAYTLFHRRSMWRNWIELTWLRRLVAGIPPRRPGFASGSVHVEFVVDKVALGQVFNRVLRFSPLSIIIHPGRRTRISSGGRTLGPLVAAVRRQSLTPSTREGKQIG
jgi:hypothetical protein